MVILDVEMCAFFAYQPQNWKGPYMMKELVDDVSLIDQLIAMFH